MSKKSTESKIPDFTDINNLISLLNVHYPEMHKGDDTLLEAWNPEEKNARLDYWDDTLALFIIRELSDVFPCDLNDPAGVLEESYTALAEAVEQLRGLCNALRYAVMDLRAYQFFQWLKSNNKNLSLRRLDSWLGVAGFDLSSCEHVTYVVQHFVPEFDSRKLVESPMQEFEVDLDKILAALETRLTVKPLINSKGAEQAK